MNRALIALAGLALSIAGCGDPNGNGSGGSTTTGLGGSTTTGIAGGTLDIIVPPEADGSLPPDLMVGCPSGPVFPASALEGIIPIEQADPGIDQAVGSFLETDEGSFWPQEGWLVLHEDEAEAIVVAETGDGLAFMEVGKSGGEWVWSGSQSGGPCPLQYVVPEGMNTVEWRLDDTVASPGPEDDTLAVILNERQCVGGQEIGDRLVGPQVVMTETRVFVAFAATPPPGDAFDCQGNPDMPYLVDLGEPIGEREVVEGSSTGLDLEDFLS